MDGKEYTFTFGNYPTLGLADVRDRLYEVKLLKQQGINPSQQKAKNKRESKYKNLNSFESLAIDWIENLYKPSGQENTKNYFYSTYHIPAITYEIGDEVDRGDISRTSPIFAQEMMRVMLERE